MSRPRLHLIDDDVQNLALLKEFLASRYDVETSSDPREGLSRVLGSRPSLVVIDLDMPQMNGFEVCEAIRASAAHDSTSVIFLTSDAQSASMQRALQVGANDYLIKPFRMQELLMRIEFRLGQAHVAAPLKCGNLRVDAATLTAAVENRGKLKLIRLTQRLFRVLEALVRNEGRILTREQLLDQAWDGKDTSDRAVDLQVFRLRKLLKGWDRSVESVYGRGYMVTTKRSV